VSGPKNGRPEEQAPRRRNQGRRGPQARLLRGACHRAGHFGPDPLARNDAARPRYHSRKSRKNDFFSLGGATGLPYESKPFLCAVSCDTGPLAGGPPMIEDGAAGGAADAVGGAPNAGPGGGSGGPARPQAAKVRAAAPSKANTKPARKRLLKRPSERFWAKTNNPRNPHSSSIADHGAEARFWRQYVAKRLLPADQALSRLSQRLAAARTFFGAVPP